MLLLLSTPSAMVPPHLRALRQCYRSLHSAAPGRLPQPPTACSSSVPAAAPGPQQEETLERILHNLRSSQGMERRAGSELRVTGTARHMGVDVAWELRCRPDGSFREEVRSPELSSAWGYDGSAAAAAAPDGAVCWEVDFSGCPRRLALDDHEEMLLSAWIRTGAWLSPGTEGALEVTLAAPGQRRGFVRAAAAGEEAQEEEVEEEGVVALSIGLKTGKVSATLRVCTRTWRPLSMAQPTSWDVESWELSGWRPWEAGVSFPGTSTNLSSSGGEHVYTAEGVRLVAEAGLAAEVLLASALAYSAPPAQLLPCDSVYLEGVPAGVPAWRTRSGHILVQPVINGQTPGYMILDTGASGFVIEPSVADGLGMAAFGELHVTGIAGKFKGQFRRGTAFTLGPLRITSPLFMEMTCADLVRGAPGPVTGIVGFDVFRRAVVDLPAHAARAAPALARGDVTSPASAVAAEVISRAALVSGTPVTIGLHNPATYEVPASLCATGAWGVGDATEAKPGPSGRVVMAAAPLAAAEAGGAGEEECELAEGGQWLPITLLASLPHITVRFKQRVGARQRGGLFMLDSGAGGVDVMFNARAVEEHGMCDPPPGGGGEPPPPKKYLLMKGVGGSSSSAIRMESGRLQWLQMGGARFERVKCLLTPPGGPGPGIEISHYTAGILCGDLLARCRLVFDYARHRVAIVREE